MEGLRKFPFPFRNMLAVLSDTDLSSKAEFEGMHRFMNTEADCGPLGRGVGLDVGDTFWMGTVGRDDDGSPPSEDDERCWRYWWSDTRREIHAAAMRRYIAAGWIDATHALFPFRKPRTAFTREQVRDVLDEWRRIGFSPLVWIDHARNPWNVATYRTAILARDAGAGDTTLLIAPRPRADGSPGSLARLERLGPGAALAFGATREVARLGDAPPVASQEPRAVALPLTGPLAHAYPAGTLVSVHPDAKPVEGAVPGSPFYCVDLAVAAGIRVFWTNLAPDLQAATERGRRGFDTTLAPLALPDGTSVWGLRRSYEYGQTNNTWLGLCIRRALRGDELGGGRPMDPDTYMIISTHLGYADADGVPDDDYTIEDDVWTHNGGRWFTEDTVAAFRELRAAQDEGRVLVANTTRLVRYNLAHDMLTRHALTEHGYTVEDHAGAERFVVHAIHDDLFGSTTPSLDDLRGITFYCHDPAAAEIHIGGAAIPRAELQANGPDDTGRPSIGVRWHRFDRTDHTARQ